MAPPKPKYQCIDIIEECSFNKHMNKISSDLLNNEIQLQKNIVILNDLRISITNYFQQMKQDYEDIKMRLQNIKDKYK